MSLPASQSTTIRKDPNKPRWKQSSSLSSDKENCGSSESDKWSENETRPVAENIAHPDLTARDILDSPSSSVEWWRLVALCSP